MSKVRVQMFGQGRGITIDSAATWGAVVGESLRWPDGSVVTEQELRAAATPPGDGGGAVYWRTIAEIPLNVTALAEQAGTGLYVLTGEGSSVTRALVVEPGELTLDNASGVDGNPTLGLPTITPGDGGTLQRYGFDDKGRRTQEAAADTDDLPEGTSNLYFTDARAIAAVGGLAGGEILVTGEVGPVALTTNDETDWLYT